MDPSISFRLYETISLNPDKYGWVHVTSSLLISDPKAIRREARSVATSVFECTGIQGVSENRGAMVYWSNKGGLATMKQCNEKIPGRVIYVFRAGPQRTAFFYCKDAKHPLGLLIVEHGNNPFHISSSQVRKYESEFLQVLQDIVPSEINEDEKREHVGKRWDMNSFSVQYASISDTDVGLVLVALIAVGSFPRRRGNTKLSTGCDDRGGKVYCISAALDYPASWQRWSWGVSRVPSTCGVVSPNGKTVHLFTVGVHPPRKVSRANETQKKVDRCFPEGWNQANSFSDSVNDCKSKAVDDNTKEESTRSSVSSIREIEAAFSRIHRIPVDVDDEETTWDEMMKNEDKLLSCASSEDSSNDSVLVCFSVQETIFSISSASSSSSAGGKSSSREVRHRFYESESVRLSVKNVDLLRQHPVRVQLEQDSLLITALISVSPQSFIVHLGFTTDLSGGDRSTRSINGADGLGAGCGTKEWRERHIQGHCRYLPGLSAEVAAAITLRNVVLDRRPQTTSISLILSTDFKLFACEVFGSVWHVKLDHPLHFFPISVLQPHKKDKAPKAETVKKHQQGLPAYFQLTPLPNGEVLFSNGAAGHFLCLVNSTSPQPTIAETFAPSRLLQHPPFALLQEGGIEESSGSGSAAVPYTMFLQRALEQLQLWLRNFSTTREDIFTTFVTQWLPRLRFYGAEIAKEIQLIHRLYRCVMEVAPPRSEGEWNEYWELTRVIQQAMSRRNKGASAQCMDYFYFYLAQLYQQCSFSTPEGCTIVQDALMHVISEGRRATMMIHLSNFSGVSPLIDYVFGTIISGVVPYVRIAEELVEQLAIISVNKEKGCCTGFTSKSAAGLLHAMGFVLLSSCLDVPVYLILRQQGNHSDEMTGRNSTCTTNSDTATSIWCSPSLPLDSGREGTCCLHVPVQVFDSQKDFNHALALAGDLLGIAPTSSYRVAEGMVVATYLTPRYHCTTALWDILEPILHDAIGRAAPLCNNKEWFEECAYVATLSYERELHRILTTVDGRHPIFPTICRALLSGPATQGKEGEGELGKSNCDGADETCGDLDISLFKALKGRIPAEAMSGCLIVLLFVMTERLVAAQNNYATAVMKYLQSQSTTPSTTHGPAVDEEREEVVVTLLEARLLAAVRRTRRMWLYIHQLLPYRAKDIADSYVASVMMSSTFRTSCEVDGSANGDGHVEMASSHELSSLSLDPSCVGTMWSRTLVFCFRFFTFVSFSAEVLQYMDDASEQFKMEAVGVSDWKTKGGNEPTSVKQDGVGTERSHHHIHSSHRDGREQGGRKRGDLSLSLAASHSPEERCLSSLRYLFLSDAAVIPKEWYQYRLLKVLTQAAAAAGTVAARAVPAPSGSVEHSIISSFRSPSISSSRVECQREWNQFLLRVLDLSGISTYCSMAHIKKIFFDLTDAIRVACSYSQSVPRRGSVMYSFGYKSSGTYPIGKDLKFSFSSENGMRGRKKEETKEVIDAADEDDSVENPSDIKVWKEKMKNCSLIAEELSAAHQSRVFSKDVHTNFIFSHKRDHSMPRWTFQHHRQERKYIIDVSWTQHLWALESDVTLLSSVATAVANQIMWENEVYLLEREKRRRRAEMTRQRPFPLLWTQNSSPTMKSSDDEGEKEQESHQQCMMRISQQSFSASLSSSSICGSSSRGSLASRSSFRRPQQLIGTTLGRPLFGTIMEILSPVGAVMMTPITTVEMGVEKPLPMKTPREILKKSGTLIGMSPLESSTKTGKESTETIMNRVKSVYTEGMVSVLPSTSPSNVDEIVASTQAFRARRHGPISSVKEESTPLQPIMRCSFSETTPEKREVEKEEKRSWRSFSRTSVVSVPLFSTPKGGGQEEKGGPHSREKTTTITTISNSSLSTAQESVSLPRCSSPPFSAPSVECGARHSVTTSPPPPFPPHDAGRIHRTTNPIAKKSITGAEVFPLPYLISRPQGSLGGRDQGEEKEGEGSGRGGKNDGQPAAAASLLGVECTRKTTRDGKESSPHTSARTNDGTSSSQSLEGYPTSAPGSAIHSHSSTPPLPSLKKGCYTDLPYRTKKGHNRKKNRCTTDTKDHMNLLSHFFGIPPTFPYSLDAVAWWEQKKKPVFSEALIREREEKKPRRQDLSGALHYSHCTSHSSSSVCYTSSSTTTTTSDSTSSSSSRGGGSLCKRSRSRSHQNDEPLRFFTESHNTSSYSKWVEKKGANCVTRTGAEGGGKKKKWEASNLSYPISAVTPPLPVTLRSRSVRDSCAPISSPGKTRRTREEGNIEKEWCEKEGIGGGKRDKRAHEWVKGRTLSRSSLRKLRKAKRCAEDFYPRDGTRDHVGDEKEGGSTWGTGGRAEGAYRMYTNFKKSSPSIRMRRAKTIPLKNRKKRQESKRREEHENSLIQFSHSCSLPQKEIRYSYPLQDYEFLPSDASYRKHKRYGKREYEVNQLKADMPHEEAEEEEEDEKEEVGDDDYQDVDSHVDPVRRSIEKGYKSSPLKRRRRGQGSEGLLTREFIGKNLEDQRFGSAPPLLTLAPSHVPLISPFASSSLEYGREARRRGGGDERRGKGMALRRWRSAPFSSSCSPLLHHDSSSVTLLSYMPVYPYPWDSLPSSSPRKPYCNAEFIQRKTEIVEEKVLKEKKEKIIRRERDDSSTDLFRFSPPVLLSLQKQLKEAAVLHLNPSTRTLAHVLSRVQGTSATRDGESSSTAAPLTSKAVFCTLPTSVPEALPSHSGNTECSSNEGRKAYSSGEGKDKRNALQGMTEGSFSVSTPLPPPPPTLLFLDLKPKCGMGASDAKERMEEGPPTSSLSPCSPCTNKDNALKMAKSPRQPIESSSEAPSLVLPASMLTTTTTTPTTAATTPLGDHCTERTTTAPLPTNVPKLLYLPHSPSSVPSPSEIFPSKLASASSEGKKIIIVPSTPEMDTGTPPSSTPPAMTNGNACTAVGPRRESEGNSCPHNPEASTSNGHPHTTDSSAFPTPDTISIPPISMPTPPMPASLLNRNIHNKYNITSTSSTSTNGDSASILPTPPMRPTMPSGDGQSSRHLLPDAALVTFFDEEFQPSTISSPPLHSLSSPPQIIQIAPTTTHPPHSSSRSGPDDTPCTADAGSLPVPPSLPPPPPPLPSYPIPSSVVSPDPSTLLAPQSLLVPSAVELSLLPLPSPPAALSIPIAPTETKTAVTPSLFSSPSAVAGERGREDASSRDGVLTNGSTESTRVCMSNGAPSPITSASSFPPSSFNPPLHRVPPPITFSPAQHEEFQRYVQQCLMQGASENVKKINCFHNVLSSQQDALPCRCCCCCSSSGGTSSGFSVSVFQKTFESMKEEQQKFLESTQKLFLEHECARDTRLQRWEDVLTRQMKREGALPLKEEISTVGEAPAHASHGNTSTLGTTRWGVEESGKPGSNLSHIPLTTLSVPPFPIPMNNRSSLAPSQPSTAPLSTPALPLSLPSPQDGGMMLSTASSPSSLPPPSFPTTESTADGPSVGLALLPVHPPRIAPPAGLAVSGASLGTSVLPTHAPSLSVASPLMSTDPVATLTPSTTLTTAGGGGGAAAGAGGGGVNTSNGGLSSVRTFMKMNDAASAAALLELNMESLDREIAAVRAHYAAAIQSTSVAGGAYPSRQWPGGSSFPLSSTTSTAITATSPSPRSAGGTAAADSMLSSLPPPLPYSWLRAPEQGSGGAGEEATGDTNSPTPLSPPKEGASGREGTAALPSPPKQPHRTSTAATRESSGNSMVQTTSEKKSSSGGASRTGGGRGSRRKNASPSHLVPSAKAPNDLSELYRQTAVSRRTSGKRMGGAGRTSPAHPVGGNVGGRASASTTLALPSTATSAARSTDLADSNDKRKNHARELIERRRGIQNIYGAVPLAQGKRKTKTTPSNKVPKGHRGLYQETYLDALSQNTQVPESFGQTGQRGYGNKKKSSEMKNIRFYDDEVKGDDDDEIWHIPSSSLRITVSPSDMVDTTPSHALPHQERQRQIMERVALLSKEFR